MGNPVYGCVWLAYPNKRDLVGVPSPRLTLLRMVGTQVLSDGRRRCGDVGLQFAKDDVACWAALSNVLISHVGISPQPAPYPP